MNNNDQAISSIFQRLRFVLVETSHPGNIGAVARAMKTMGFSQLVLVNPRFEDALSHPEAIAFASGALDVLENARVADSIESALSGCHFVASVSARLREFSPPVLTPRLYAEKLGTMEECPVALVFGSERFGLPNEIVMNSNVLINVPANPAYSSLNLAQAVQILAYEVRTQHLDLPLDTSIGFQGVSASNDQVEAMFLHLEQALVSIDFLDPSQPKKLMPRLRRLFARAQLELEEVNILRGIAKKILDAVKAKRQS